MKIKQFSKWRFYFLIFVLTLGLLALIWRMLDLNVIKRSFLQQQSNIRSVRVIDIPAHRGMILDRNGMPLAVSTPVESVWINPQLFKPTREQLKKLAQLLHIPYLSLKKTIRLKSSRWFVYLKRHIAPELAGEIKKLDITGLYFQEEYRRFYSQGEVSAHVIGFTNIDDIGQEGLELAYDSWLRGIPGKEKVVKDRRGNIVAVLGVKRPPRQGRNLTISIDQRIQYLAYLELKKTVEKNQAESGSIVVLDVKSGEILAMVNQPSYNPNNRPIVHDGRYRNRAVTDVFEPGSTIKTFSIASALESGKYKPGTKVDTDPGWYVVDGKTITDEGVNHGVLTLTGVLQKSSNIGMAKITLSLPAAQLWETLNDFGFGERTQSGFPGEVPGSLVNHQIWRPIVLANLSFGYGVSVTPLQLASAYAIIAARGIKRPVTFLKEQQVPEGNRVISTKTTQSLLTMLKSVTSVGGTGMRASVPGYTVAGKTGTANIAGRNGYDPNQHMADFVGIAPVANPRLVVAVVIKNPQEQHFGGLVAAPAFAHIMGGALRYLNVPPEKKLLEDVIPANIGIVEANNEQRQEYK